MTSNPQKPPMPQPRNSTPLNPWNWKDVLKENANEFIGWGKERNYLAAGEYLRENFKISEKY